MQLLIIRLCRLGLTPEPDDKSPAKTACHIVMAIEQGTSAPACCARVPKTRCTERLGSGRRRAPPAGGAPLIFPRRSGTTH
eukprot:7780837-Pyramimonas_sp.AAC.1